MDGYLPGGKKNIINFTGETECEVQAKIRDYRIEKIQNSGSLGEPVSYPFHVWNHLGKLQYAPV